MPQPHRGDRVLTSVYVPRTVRDALEDAQRAAGYRYLGDYCAAVISVHVGREDLAPGPNFYPAPLPIEAVQPLPRPAQPALGVDAETLITTPVRLPRPVRQILDQRAGKRQVSPYLARLLAAHVGLPDYAPTKAHANEQELPMTG